MITSVGIVRKSRGYWISEFPKLLSIQAYVLRTIITPGKTFMNPLLMEFAELHNR